AWRRRTASGALLERDVCFPKVPESIANTRDAKPHGATMSMLRRYCRPTIVALLSAWWSWPVAAEGPLGCDGISGLPRVDYLASPRNLGLFKQQLLIYRCTRYDNEIGLIVQEARAWVKQRAPQVSNPTIVLDIDETSLSNWTRIYQDE